MGIDATVLHHGPVHLKIPHLQVGPGASPGRSKFPNTWVNFFDVIGSSPNNKYLISIVELFPDVLFDFDEVVSVQSGT